MVPKLLYKPGKRNHSPAPQFFGSHGYSDQPPARCFRGSERPAHPCGSHAAPQAGRSGSGLWIGHDGSNVRGEDYRCPAERDGLFWDCIPADSIGFVDPDREAKL